MKQTKPERYHQVGQYTHYGRPGSKREREKKNLKKNWINNGWNFSRLRKDMNNIHHALQISSWKNSKRSILRHKQDVDSQRQNENPEAKGEKQFI